MRSRTCLSRRSFSISSGFFQWPASMIVISMPNYGEEKRSDEQSSQQVVFCKHGFRKKEIRGYFMWTERIDVASPIMTPSTRLQREDWVPPWDFHVVEKLRWMGSLSKCRAVSPHRGPYWGPLLHGFHMWWTFKRGRIEMRELRSLCIGRPIENWKKKFLFFHTFCFFTADNTCYHSKKEVIHILFLKVFLMILSNSYFTLKSERQNL